MPRKKLSIGLPHAVIDTTLLSRLVDLEIAEKLPWVFKIIRIPPEVRREAYKSPGRGKRRLRKLIQEMEGFFVDCPDADALIKNYLMADLDAGEAAAIAQAEHTKSVLLLDEKKGHRRAMIMDVQVIRTTELLCLLKEAGAIDAVRVYLDKLEITGFYLSRKHRAKILIQVGEESNG